jgi:gliding motility-associated-like protein
VIGNVFNPAVVGEGTYTFSIAHGIGECATYDSLQVRVLPQLISTISSSEDTICNGEGVTITVSASGGVPNVLYSYEWSHDLFSISSNAVSPEVTTTYMVTTSDGCSDDAIDTITIAIAEGFAVLFETSSKACSGSDGFVSADVLGTSNYSYLWGTTPVQTGDSIVGFAGDSYTVNILDINSGCEFDTLIKIPSYPIVNALFSISPNVECVSFDQKDLLAFIDLSKYVDSGYWDFGNGVLLPYVFGENPSPSFTKSGYYKVELTGYNEGGCMDVYSLDLCIYDPVELFVADAFSPNGDGVNDFLFVRGNGLVELDFLVYNRWGQKVFESHDVNLGWDGTFKGMMLNSEVFVYYVYAVTRQGVEIEAKGDVSLVR